MLLKLRFLKFIFIFLLTSSIAADEVLEINTPGVSEVEIFAKSNFDQKETKVGLTPFKENLKSFISRFSKVNIVVIELRKQGYQTKNFVIMKGSDFDIKLSIAMKPQEDIKLIQKTDLMIAELFKIQKSIRSQDYVTAQDRLTLLQKDFKDYSIIPELKGIASYMSKDIEGALGHFREAFSLNPKNSDAYKMKIYLEKKLGIATDDNG